MKIAISGKGGVGKSTLAAALSLLLAEKGERVLAVDADPDANLAAALGISSKKQADIIPIAEQVALIEERTGAKVSQYGQIFKINPEVADIADKYATTHKGVALLVLGAVEKGGGGCACPENVLLKALVSDLVLYKNESLVMDMEAGVEHLGRATTRGVDMMLIVVEPGQRSVDCARKVIRLGEEIGLNSFKIVANKICRDSDEGFVREAFPRLEIAGVIPFSNEFRELDRSGKSVLDGISSDLRERFEEILENL
ncbi:MAG: AAA family ATPase [Kiritimatiellaeota bacterium]|nr:AAA family ATPase [Kiritimatiellota bacterium]